MMIHFGRNDFDNIDNEALDFEQLEAFIQNNSSVVQSPTHPNNGSTHNQSNNPNEPPNPTNLPESPPDSGSEPPYSPNVKNLQLVDQMSHMNTLTELHVPHHHSMMTPSAEQLYISNEHPQFGNLLQQHANTKHENQILHPTVPTATPQDHMMLYQVNQSGQIIELNHIHHPNQQPVNGRMLELVDASTSHLHELQHGGSNLADNLQIMGENFTQIGNHQQSSLNPSDNVKKRRAAGNFNGALDGGEVKVKGYGKTSEPKTVKHYFGNKSKKRHHHHVASASESTAAASEVRERKANDKKAQNSEIKADTFHHENIENKSNNAFAESASSAKGNESGSDGSQIQCIRFSTFQQQQWHTLLDHNHQELTTPHFRVDADKGFNFSNSDEAFVCQKKNHFQITCHSQLHGNGVYVKTPSGIEKIRTFHIHFYGVKSETPTQTIRIEQSQSDRSKKPFFPVLVDLQNGQVSKVTVGRLHFSETTCNNMRKKGRPNPEQRYFQLVVGLHAHTFSGYYPVVSHASERIIVRASNPGQFEGEVDLCCWQRGVPQNSIFYQGKIGINTDMPDECLVVNGNMKLSGHIVQPSDVRVKDNICELNASEQLANINQIRIVRYKFQQKFAGNQEFDSDRYQTGIIAQELQKILPEAVHDGGEVKLSDGTRIEHFLQIDKERVFMENIGAVQHLTKMTENLEKRMESFENLHRISVNEDFNNNDRAGIFDKMKIFQFMIILTVFFAALWH